MFFSNRFPFAVQAHCFAYKLRLPMNHNGPIHLTLRVDDDNGENIKLFSQDASLPPKHPGLGFEPLIGALFVDYLTFQRPGVHYATLSDGQEKLAAIPLFAVQSSGRG